MVGLAAVGVKLVGDVVGHLGAGGNGGPGGRLEGRVARLDAGRHVRQCGQGLLAGHGQGLELARSDVGARRGHRVDRDLDAATDQVRERQALVSLSLIHISEPTRPY